jgi:hypothetical protein
MPAGKDGYGGHTLHIPTFNRITFVLTAESLIISLYNIEKSYESPLKDPMNKGL